MDMEKPLAEAQRYLQDVLGIIEAGPRGAQPWVGAGQLPFFFQEHYAFYQAELLDTPCLLMLSRSPEGETPAVVRKHWQAVAKQFQGEVIYLVAAITSYNRKRLIEQGVQFLVPGNQLYVPRLGVDLRERFNQRQRADKATLSAAAQALVIREILLRDCTETPAKVLADRLGYSSMTVSRAIKELEDKQLVEVEKVGREKRLRFREEGRLLWEAALPRLQSPVKKRVSVLELGNSTSSWVEHVDARLAGDAAMAQYTALAGPGSGIWAVNASEWPGLKKLLAIKELEATAPTSGSVYRYESDVTQVELWSYNPAIAERLWNNYHERLVDPLSLWLSLDNTEDERLAMAKDTLLEQVWSRLTW